VIERYFLQTVSIACTAFDSIFLVANSCHCNQAEDVPLSSPAYYRSTPTHQQFGEIHTLGLPSPAVKDGRNFCANISCCGQEMQYPTSLCWDEDQAKWVTHVPYLQMEGDIYVFSSFQSAFIAFCLTFCVDLLQATTEVKRWSCC